MRVSRSLLWCACAFSLLGLSGCPQSSGPPASPRHDRGFNYFHEIWRDTWPKPKGPPTALLPKATDQFLADFRCMRKTGATAVRIHGAGHGWVFKCVDERIKQSSEFG